MITLLFRALMFLTSAGIGLIVADLVLEGFTIEWSKWWIIVWVITALGSVLLLRIFLKRRVAQRRER